MMVYVVFWGLDMDVRVSWKFYIFQEVFDLVKISVNWGLGIVVHLFFLVFKSNQLAGGYFTICYNELLDKHENGSRNLSVVLFLMEVV